MEVPALDDRAPSRGDRRPGSLVGATQHGPQGQPNAIAPVPIAVAERPERRLHPAVVLRWDHILERDVAADTTRLTEADEPIEVVVNDTERFAPGTRRPPRGDRVGDSKRRRNGSIRLGARPGAEIGAQPKAVQRLTVQ